MPDLTPITREEMFLDGNTELTPITREEKILAGEDIDVITRREWFLKKYRSGGDITVESLSVTENGTYTAPSGKAYSPVSVDVPLPTNAYLLKSVANLPQAIASFNDGQDMVMPSLKVAIEPQQDLHGYDSPWVGGAGKNKCGEFELGTLTESSTQGSTYDNMKVSNTARIRSKTLIEIPSTCTISCANGYQYAFTGYDSNMEYLGIYQFYTWRSEAYTFDNSTIKYIAIIIKRDDEGNIQSNDYTNCHIQLESGNQATSYAPYSNICPISGWSAVDVTRTGKNLFDKDTVTFAEGFITNTGEVSTTIPSYEHTSYIKVNPNTNYVFLGDIIGANLVNAVAFYNSKKEFISRFAPPANTPASFTTPNNCVYISTNVYNIKQVNTIQLEEGLIATEYEPFGATYTIDLDGTRYGGTLDVVSGVLTVDRGYFKYINISTTSGVAVTYGWRCNFTCPTDDINKGKWNIQTDATPIFNKISVVTKGYGANEYTVTLPNVTSKQEADAMLEGLEICYKLATPFTIQLTPTAIKSLRGVNNVYANTGDIKDAEYFSKEAE